MSIVGSFIVPHPPLIVSEIGKGKEKQIQATLDSYEVVAKKIAALEPETIFITTPHSTMYSDYIHISPGAEATGNFANFRANNVSFKKQYDMEFVTELESLASKKNIMAGTLGQKDKMIDHGALVPIYFIEKYIQNYKIVRCSISGLSFLEHYHFGKCISEVAEKLNRKVVFIASGDLSHRLKEDGPYGFTEEGSKFDKEITDAMKEANFLKFMNFDTNFCDRAGECGLRSFIIMAGALDGKSVKSNFYSYEGTFGVGYAVCEFKILEEDNNRHFDLIYQKQKEQKFLSIRNNEDNYVKLARMSLEYYIKTHKVLKTPNDLDRKLLDNQAGVFVSLKKDGMLRGCIGTIVSTTDSIADEIINNAISAGTKDPRFEAIAEYELPEIVYSVDVLGEAETINSIDELDAKKYGVIVTKGNRRGLLLPNLEGVNTPKEQIEIALSKAGIKESENFSIQRFEVVRHK